MNIMNALPSEKQTRQEKYQRTHRSQDHGTAAAERGLGYNRDTRSYDRQVPQRILEKLGGTEVAAGATEYLASLSPRELDEIADQIITDADQESEAILAYNEGTLYDEAEALAQAEEEDQQTYYEELMTPETIPDVNTPARVKREMARNAMLDPANDEDDYGDFPTQSVRKLN